MQEQADIWERIKSEAIADCRVFGVRKDTSRRVRDSTDHTFYVVENPDWVNIVALTKKDEVVLIEQFRHGTEELVLEIPGGMLDDNEEPETAAARELVEETGFEAREMIFLGKSRPNPAIQNNWIYHFLAVDCEKTRDTSFDEHESAATKVVAYESIGGLIANGDITHSLAITGFYFLSLYRSHLKR